MFLGNCSLKACWKSASFQKSFPSLFYMWLYHVSLHLKLSRVALLSEQVCLSQGHYTCLPLLQGPRSWSTSQWSHLHGFLVGVRGGHSNEPWLLTVSMLCCGRWNWGNERETLIVKCNLFASVFLVCFKRNGMLCPASQVCQALGKPCSNTGHCFTVSTSDAQLKLSEFPLCSGNGQLIPFWD